jgi:hypothetical protein
MAEAVIHPSSVPITGAAPHHECFAANFGTTTLTTRVGKPNHAPQLVDFTNAGTTAQSAIGTAKNGSAFSKVIPPGATYSCIVPLSEIHTDSGADISAVCYWWPTPDHVINPA